MEKDTQNNNNDDPKLAEGESESSSQSELEECKKKCDEYLNNWKRSAADFLNYKKDEMERMRVLTKYATEDMILKMLPILDSIDLASKQMQEDIKANAWSEGFLQIQKQITEFLKKEGIEEIETVGKPFDPETMEVVEETSNTQNLTPNTVVEELQKGYMIGDKVLRPAKVKVTK